MIPAGAQSRALQSGLACLVLAAALAAGSARAVEPGDESSEAAHYHIVDGKVDESTYLGWRTFHSACHGCHGVDATGTSVAPNLLERVEDLTPRDFSTKVLTRYRLVFGSEELAGDDQTALRRAMMEQVLGRELGELIMPAWGGDPNVRPHVLDLYAYLKARADGVLGPGRPERMSD